MNSLDIILQILSRNSFECFPRYCLCNSISSGSSSNFMPEIIKSFAFQSKELKVKTATCFQKVRCIMVLLKARLTAADTAYLAMVDFYFSFTLVIRPALHLLRISKKAGYTFTLPRIRLKSACAPRLSRGAIEPTRLLSADRRPTPPSQSNPAYENAKKKCST